MTQTLELSARIRQLEHAVASLPSLETDLVRLTSQIQDAHAAREKLEKVNQALEGNVLVLVPEPPIDLLTITQRFSPPAPQPELPVITETPPEAVVAEAPPAPRRGPPNPEGDVLAYFAANPSEALARAVAAALPHLATSTVSAALRSLVESGQLERSGTGGSTSPYWYSVKSVNSAMPEPSPAPQPTQPSFFPDPEPTPEPSKARPTPPVDKAAPRAERVTHQANLPRDLPPLSSKRVVASLEEQTRILAVLKGAPNGLSSSLLASKLNKDKPIRFDVLVANLEALKDGGKAQAQEGKWRLA